METVVTDASRLNFRFDEMEGPPELQRIEREMEDDLQLGMLGVTGCLGSMLLWKLFLVRKSHLT